MGPVDNGRKRLEITQAIAAISKGTVTKCAYKAKTNEHKTKKPSLRYLQIETHNYSNILGVFPFTLFHVGILRPIFLHS